MSFSHNLKVKEAKERQKEFIYSLSTIDLIKYVEEEMI